MLALVKDCPAPVKLPSAPLSTRTAERSAVAADSLRASGRLRLRVSGESMLPTLWPGDVVEIASCSLAGVRPGEIVLAVRDGRFFLHRLLARSKADGFLLRGDSMPGPDPEFPNEALLGRLARRAGRGKDPEQTQPIRPLRPWSWAIGRLICHFRPARRLALKFHFRRQKAEEIRNAAKSANLGTMDPGTS